MKLFNANIRIGIVLVVALSFSISIPYFIFQSIEKHIKSDIENSFHIVLETAEKSILLWVKEEKALAKSWATNSNIISYVEILTKIPETQDSLQNNPATNQIRNMLNPILKSKPSDLFFIISKNNVNIASLNDKDLAQPSLLFKNTEMFNRAFSGETIITLPQLSAFSLLNTTNSLQPKLSIMCIATPIYNSKNQVIALLAFQMDTLNKLSELLKLGKVGTSGETYAFNKNAVLISKSRFNEQLKKIGLIGNDRIETTNILIRDPGKKLRKENYLVNSIYMEDKPLTLMAKSAISGFDGQNFEGYRDYRGVSVVGVWKWNEELGFGIATEMDSEEAFSTLNLIKNSLIIVTFINCFLIFLIGGFSLRYLKFAEHLSFKDGLTGVANRRMLDTRLEFELNRSIRNKSPLALCMIDIDYFKKFNDHFGHLAGDEALKKVAMCIKGAVKRRSDLVARYGGEEFCVVLPNTTINEARCIAENIRLSILEKKLSRDNSDEFPWLTVSIGVSSQILHENSNVKNLIAEADKALYLAKNSGRNCTRTFAS